MRPGDNPYHCDFKNLVDAVNEMAKRDKDCGFYNDDGWIKAYNIACEIANSWKLGNPEMTKRKL